MTRRYRRCTLAHRQTPVRSVHTKALLPPPTELTLSGLGKIGSLAFDLWAAGRQALATEQVNQKLTEY